MMMIKVIIIMYALSGLLVCLGVAASTRLRGLTVQGHPVLASRHLPASRSH